MQGIGSCAKLQVGAVFGTSRILRLEKQHVSPANGLLLSLCSPQLIANMRCLSSPNHDNLSRELYFQREDKNTGRRYGPAAIVGSRSQAAFWLDPRALGAVVGIAISNASTPKGKSVVFAIDKRLGNLGIECNYVRGVWSGVSLARYKKLIKIISTEYQDHHQQLQQLNQHTNSVSGSSSYSYSSSSAYALPLVLSHLWDKSTSKYNLLEFLLEAEHTSGDQILSDEYADLRVDGSKLRQQWLHDTTFPTHELTKPRVIDAVKTLSQYYRGTDRHTLLDSSSYSSMDGDIDRVLSQSPYRAEYRSSAEYLGVCHEVVCASLARERTYKPAIKLGRHAYGDDGKEKPDCVEVVLREIVEGLLFDVDTQSINSDYIPKTASPALKAFFAKNAAAPTEDNHHRAQTATTAASNSSDVADKVVQPTTRRSCSSAAATATTTATTATTNTTTTSVGTNYITTDKKAPALTPEAAAVAARGKEWFDLCSELPHCVYLSHTPSDGRKYELKPGMVNVCKALGTHLTNYVAAASASAAATSESITSTSMTESSAIATTTATSFDTGAGTASVDSGSKLWNSLKDLEVFWNSHVRNLQQQHQQQQQEKLQQQVIEGSSITSTICKSGTTPATVRSANISTGTTGAQTTGSSSSTSSSSTSSNVSIRTHSIPSLITVSQRILQFRAPFSDTEKITREIGIIDFIGRNDRMEVELEESHGLATVRHSKINSSDMIWVGEPLHGCMLAAWRDRIMIDNRTAAGAAAAVALEKRRSSDDWFTHDQQANARTNANATATTLACGATAGAVTTTAAAAAHVPINNSSSTASGGGFWDILQAAVLNDILLTTLHDTYTLRSKEQQQQKKKDIDTNVDYKVRMLEQALLAARWGEERTGVRISADGVFSAADGALANAETKAAAVAAARLSAQAIELICSLAAEHTASSNATTIAITTATTTDTEETIPLPVQQTPHPSLQRQNTNRNNDRSTSSSSSTSRSTSSSSSSSSSSTISSSSNKSSGSCTITGSTSRAIIDDGNASISITIRLQTMLAWSITTTAATADLSTEQLATALLQAQAPMSLLHSKTVIAALQSRYDFHLLYPMIFGITTTAGVASSSNSSSNNSNRSYRSSSNNSSGNNSITNNDSSAKSNKNVTVQQQQAKATTTAIVVKQPFTSLSLKDKIKVALFRFKYWISK